MDSGVVIAKRSLGASRSDFSRAGNARIGPFSARLKSDLLEQWPGRKTTTPEFIMSHFRFRGFQISKIGEFKKFKNSTDLK